MTYRLGFLVLIIALSLSGIARAVQPNEMLADPQLEARARHISEDLRCLVCQNQSIDDSDADLAHDLRVLVRQRLQAGDSDEQVKQYLVARYGDYVLLKPPLKPSTVILWVSAPLFVAIGATAAFIFYRRKEIPDAGQPLTAAEKERLARLIEKADS